MEGPVKKGLPVIGIIFLLLALLKFVQGGNWVVWAILGVLMGGLGVFAAKKPAGDAAGEQRGDG